MQLNNRRRRTADVHVLMVTSEWPTNDGSKQGPFIRRQAEFLRSAGIHIDVFHFRGSRNPWNYLSAWLRCSKMLRRKNYDLIHAQFGQAGLITLPKRVPVIVTFRGNDLLGIPDRSGQYTLAGRLLVTASKWISTKADAVVVVAEHMIRCLPNGVNASVIPSGIDLTLFAPIERQSARRILNWDAEQRVVLFVGNPDEGVKNIDLAMQAMKLLPSEKGMRLQVVWNVPHAEIPILMSAADALLFTSIHEGSPNAVKEALACNLPVVSVPVGDVPVRCGHLESCVVTKGWNADELARGLLRVVGSPRRSEGRDSILDLDESLLAKKMIDVYRSVLN